jgi:hypothetical protein
VNFTLNRIVTTLLKHQANGRVRLFQQKTR